MARAVAGPEGGNCSCCTATAFGSMDAGAAPCQTPAESVCLRRTPVGKTKGTVWTAADYDRAALKYSRSLPLEHFMEALPQSTQREITLESLALLRARRPEVQVFNELLVQ